jgi:DNA-binding transcriptional LysR family regulator
MAMSMPHALDADLLRAFVLIAEGRSFTEVAEMVGRTQSAVSMQIKRLEEVLGQKVLSRGKGGDVELTPHGEFLLAHARQILSLNDEVVAMFRAPTLAGTVRLGTPDDYAFGYLPPILKRFADTHPAAQVDVLCAPSNELIERLKDGELDLTLVSNGHQPRHWPTVQLWRGPLVWVTSSRHAPHRLDPLPLALAQVDTNASRNCDWARAATTALQRAGRRYRLAYSSGSQIGTHAPVLAGLAVTVSTLSWLPDGLRPLRADEGLPALPEFGIVLLKGRRPRQPMTDALAAQIEAGFRAVGLRRGEAA